MEYETGRPRVYIAQSEPMDNTNIRLTHWHRRMARMIDRRMTKTTAVGEVSRGARWAIEFTAQQLGLVDLIEQPKKKSNQ